MSIKSCPKITNTVFTNNEYFFPFSNYFQKFGQFDNQKLLPERS